MSLRTRLTLDDQLAAVGLHGRERERLQRLRRYTQHPSATFLLATEVLGYDRLTEAFHKPLLDEWDRRDFLFDVGKYDKDELDLWARDHYKTTCMIARVIKRYLQDPTRTVTWYHAVEEKAVQSAMEVGHHIQCNKELREMMPEAMKPPPISKFRKWNSAGKFRFPCNQGRKDPSMFATGAGSESTGGHSRIVVLDDIIGEKTVADSAMPRVRDWLGQTVANVLETGGQQYAIGTRWDDDDVWNDMIRSGECDVRIRSCYAESGEPVLYTKKELRKKRHKPGMTAYIWSCQMENNPIPDEARRWKEAEERRCTLEEAMKGKGVTVVLSDPAPMGLSIKGTKDKVRGEAGKDYWSIAVVRVRRKGDLHEHILLDGERSQRWSEEEGWLTACRLQKKWRTRHFFNESYSGDSWTTSYLRVARQEGLKPYLEKRDGGWRLPKYKDNYSANQKNLRFEALADLNNQGQFIVCDVCPRQFVEGDRHHTGALTQARKWMPLPGGRSNLKWDDDLDAVARSTDSAVLKLAPKADFEELQAQSPFRPLRQPEQYAWATRHIRFS